MVRRLKVSITGEDGEQTGPLRLPGAWLERPKPRGVSNCSTSPRRFPALNSSFRPRKDGIAPLLLGCIQSFIGKIAGQLGCWALTKAHAHAQSNTAISKLDFCDPGRALFCNLLRCDRRARWDENCEFVAATDANVAGKARAICGSDANVCEGGPKPFVLCNRTVQGIPTAIDIALPPVPFLFSCRYGFGRWETR